jgi:hypothetical protein
MPPATPDEVTGDDAGEAEDEVFQVEKPFRLQSSLLLVYTVDIIIYLIIQYTTKSRLCPRKEMK